MPQTHLKQLIKRGLLASGYYRREIERTVFPGPVVLCYHSIRSDAPGDPLPFHDLHVSEAVFEPHCRMLSEHCHPIDLDALRDFRRGAQRPARPVLVTFDDGYRSVLDRALPILRRYGIPAVVFVCDEPIARRRLLWFDRVARAHGEGAVDAMKTLDYGAWLARTHPEDACDETDPQAVLTIDELRLLACAPGIEIGSHSSTHPILARATREQQCHEIAASKDAIERWLGTTVRAFAYPGGRPSLDYTRATVSLVRECGYTDGFCIGDRYVSDADDQLDLPRFTVLGSVNECEFAHRLCHAWPR